MFEFIGRVITGIGEALKLNPRVFEVVESSSNGGWVILVIAILGGASLLVGQSVILFVNRVRPGRFAVSLLTNGIVFTIGLLVWALFIWLSGLLLYDSPNVVPLRTVMRIVALGAAPYLFGFLVLIPYLGDFIGRVLSVWSFLVVLAGITYLAGGNFWPALICTSLGWLLITVMSLTIGRPIVALRNRLFRAVAGTDLDASVADILTSYASDERTVGTTPKGGQG
ncbi:MAG: hypothetical protein HGA45_19825 [Chloroflexales bacterium]|nr:hypothetical protein [Chloroflexales bacterium]